MELTNKVIKSIILSLTILMIISQIQLYFQIVQDSPVFIKIGYPFQYFYFSIDGNLLHGSNPKNFIFDLLLIALVIMLILILKGKISKK